MVGNRSSHANLVIISLALVLALVPLTSAHNTSNAPGRTPSVGTSGVYVMSPSVLVTSGLFPIDLGRTELFPDGFVSNSNGICDLEALSDRDPSTTHDNVLDETVVDSYTQTGGMVPDGTWDDGGIGVVCHTDGYAGYTSVGCGGTSYASDLISGGSIWIGAACDYESVTPGLVTGFLSCSINAAIGPGGVPATIDCATQFANCAADPQCGPPVRTCGPDGTMDAISYGRGGDGVTYPGTSSLCLPYPVGGATWVYDTVHADMQAVDPAMSGVVDWSG